MSVWRLLRDIIRMTMFYVIPFLNVNSVSKHHRYTGKHKLVCLQSMTFWIKICINIGRALCFSGGGELDVNPLGDAVIESVYGRNDPVVELSMATAFPSIARDFKGRNHCLITSEPAPMAQWLCHRLMGPLVLGSHLGTGSNSVFKGL